MWEGVAVQVEVNPRILIDCLNTLPLLFVSDFGEDVGGKARLRPAPQGSSGHICPEAPPRFTGGKSGTWLFAVHRKPVQGRASSGHISRRNLCVVVLWVILTFAHPFCPREPDANMPTLFFYFPLFQPIEHKFV